MNFQEVVSSAPGQAWESVSRLFPGLSSWRMSGPFPWAVLIAFGVLALALVVQQFVNTTVEDKHAYLGVIAAFLVIYIVAAVAIGSFTPSAIAGS